MSRCGDMAIRNYPRWRWPPFKKAKPPFKKQTQKQPKQVRNNNNICLLEDTLYIRTLKFRLNLVFYRDDIIMHLMTVFIISLGFCVCHS